MEVIETTGRQGRISKQLPDYLKEKEEYCKLIDEALGHTLYRTCFRRSYEPVVRQTAE
jgi:hypothetical protein